MSDRLKLLLLSTSRSDYAGLLGVLLGVLIAIDAGSGVVCRQVSSRNRDGLERLEMHMRSFNPDLVLFLGDRFELLQAVASLVPLRVPLAHLHGGESTEGAFDDDVRHALTKLSHLHFVAHEEYAQRVLQLGEEAWRVHLVGAPALDLLEPIPDPERCRGDYLLVVYNTVTRELSNQREHLEELAAALTELGLPARIVGPVPDPGANVISTFWESWAARNGHQYHSSLSLDDYWAALSGALALVGNSSSGLIEAPSLSVPTVNIGTRQAGRVRARSVIDVGNYRQEIVLGVRRALSPAFRPSLDGTNPLWRGGAGVRILEVIRSVFASRSREELLRKRFCQRSRG